MEIERERGEGEREREGQQKENFHIYSFAWKMKCYKIEMLFNILIIHNNGEKKRRAERTLLF